MSTLVDHVALSPNGHVVGLEPGVSLKNGTYRIKTTLGQGGFGITYLAEHVAMRRDVCIKEFYIKQYCERNAISHDVEVSSPNFAALLVNFRDKFQKEARLLGRMDHPNIVHVYDSFSENNTAYYVMEFIEGESLWDILQRDGALSEADARVYLKQIADAIGYIHGCNMLHLDVKPQNIMIRHSDNKATLIDFGLTKHYNMSDGMQTTASVSGYSNGYASIEQYDSRGIAQFQPEIDIYSLGATFYAMLTAKHPPHTNDVNQMDVFPEAELKMSKSARRAIQTAMQFDIRNRPHSVEEFSAMLGSLEPPSGGKSRRLVAVIASLLVIIGAAVASYVMLNDGEDAPAEVEISTLLAEAERLLAEQRSDEAFELFHEAAERGDALAQLRVGECYRMGVGTSEDYEQAIQWFTRAAEQENEQAYMVLGECYYNGDIVQTDISKAIEWYARAANMGNAVAQYNLGICYLADNASTYDVDLAIEWLFSAAQQGNVAAQCHLGKCYRYKGNNEFAVYWLQMAAEAGSVEAEYELARHYLAVNDDEAAVYWYGVAAEHGHSEAQYIFGIFHESGRGNLDDSDENKAKAVYWYEQAAAHGHDKALYRLGVCYEYGIGVEQDMEQAEEFYRQAAEAGNESALDRISSMN